MQLTCTWWFIWPVFLFWERLLRSLSQTRCSSQKPPVLDCHLSWAVFDRAPRLGLGAPHFSWESFWFRSRGGWRTSSQPLPNPCPSSANPHRPPAPLGALQYYPCTRKPTKPDSWKWWWLPHISRSRRKRSLQTRQVIIWWVQARRKPPRARTRKNSARDRPALPPSSRCFYCYAWSFGTVELLIWKRTSRLKMEFGRIWKFHRLAARRKELSLR